MSRRFSAFTEKPADRLNRMLREESEKLQAARAKLMAGSMTFSLQQVRQGKEEIFTIQQRIRALEKKLGNL